MYRSFRPHLTALTLFVLLFPISGQADIASLSGTLDAANQNGSDPTLVTDPAGVVPTDASGSIKAKLDTNNNTLSFELEVTGIARSELRDFGPNNTPIHLHLASDGSPGDFGPIAIDLSLNATEADFIDTENGFLFARENVSILLEDQGNVQLGMHPGNEQILDALRSGNTFVLVHTSKAIFTNTAGPAPGFPFGEIRGNIKVDPMAAKGNPALGMDTIVLSDATDVSSAVAELSAKLKEQGFEIPLVLDHLAAAASVGLVQAPNQVIFARPPHYLEKQLLRKSITIGIDLPLKFQIFEQDGKILLSTNTLGYLIDRHEMSIHDFVLKLTDKLIGQFGTPNKDNQGLITVTSLQSFETTVQALQDTISTNPDARIPLVVDYGERPQKSSASHQGNNPRLSTLIVFGNPKVGTPLMQADARIGIDLPLEYLVWKNQLEEVQITYNSPHYIAGRINLQGQDERLDAIAKALENIAMAGAGRGTP